MNPFLGTRLPLLSAAEMREADRTAIEAYGIPGIELMENAGKGAWRVIRHRFLSAGPGVAEGRHMVVLAGKGNNGGDGLVVARLAHQEGQSVEVMLLADPAELRGDAAQAHRRAVEAGVSVSADPAGAAVQQKLATADLVVDGLLGTGLGGPPRGVLADVIRQVLAWRDADERKRRIVALDVPSGLNADTGRAYDPAIRADRTVTFGAIKLGLAMGPAAAYTGPVTHVDIGIPPEVTARARAGLVLPEAVAAAWPRFGSDAHKGTRGRLWIVAGSRGMTGAAVLSAWGGQRGGAGLVYLAVPASEREFVAPSVPEALTVPLPDTEAGILAESARNVLRTRLAAVGIDAMVLGPGLGQAGHLADWVAGLLAEVNVPVVVDADALNALAAVPEGLSGEWVGAASGPRVLTPHPGEAARLLRCSVGEIQADRPSAARRLAEASGAVVLLKGARTVIAEPDGTLWVNPTGSPALATGGSGDVLAGLIGALCAQGLTPAAAAICGAFLHGWAGQCLARELGPTGVTAGDLPREIARRVGELHRAGRGARFRGILSECGFEEGDG